VTIFDDLQAEEERLEEILEGLDDAEWRQESAADGWSVADVVLHLAQSEEAVSQSAGSSSSLTRFEGLSPGDARTMDSLMDALVRAERSESPVVFERWQTARRAALDTLRSADPDVPLAWATNPLRPSTLATTRLAEHWAHGLDITEALGIPFDDTDRLRHIAWLAHRSLPYAFALAGEDAPEIGCDLSGPEGDHWEIGPRGATSQIAGPAGDFCRVGAQRMTPEQSRLVATGPDGPRAVALLRNYAA